MRFNHRMLQGGSRSSRVSRRQGDFNIGLKSVLRHRYAITVWYFDSEERAEAKRKFRDLTGWFDSNVANAWQRW